jgi:hypothetical protein
MGQKYAVNFPYTDYFVFPCVSFNLDVPTGAPMYTEGPGEVSAWGSVGRTTCETAPARHPGPRSLLANVGHS